MSRHLTADDLRHALAHGFDPPGRDRLLGHLGRGCVTCLATLEAESGTLPLRLTLAGAGLKDGKIDALTSTLRRLLWLFQRKDREAATSCLRPAQAYWVRQFREKPLGALYLLVEECFSAALTDPVRAREWTRSALEALGAPGLSDEGASLGALRSLALAYHGDACRRSYDHLQAQQCFRDARSIVGLGGVPLETRVTILELESQLFQEMGESNRALGQLAEALALLRKSPRVPGRLAQLYYRQGSALLLLGHYTAATEAFQAALGDLSAGAHLELRSRILLRMATVKYLCCRTEEAWSLLYEAEALYETHATALTKAQGAWLRGALWTQARIYDDAEKAIRDALERFLSLGRIPDAVFMVGELGGLYLLQDKDPSPLALEFAALLQTPESKSFTYQQLRRAREIARRLQVEVPELDRRLEELEAQHRRQSN